MRIVKKLLRILLVIIVAFVGWISALALTTAKPDDVPGWSRLSDMPNPRGEVASAVGTRIDDDEEHLERFFVIGGLAGAGRTVRTVSIFDPSVGKSGAWREGPELPAQRHHAAAAGLGGAVYVSGGSEKATRWTPLSNFWFLLPTEGEWATGPAMPEGRMGHQMAAVGTRLFVIGGRGKTSNVLIFDVSTNTWSTGAQMPAQRDHLAIAVAGPRIFAIGGRDDQLLARVDIYDTVLDSWSSGPSLPIPMSAMAAGATLEPDSGVHVVGGEDPATFGGGVINRHFFLGAAADEWVEAPLPSIAVHGPAYGVIFGKLFIAGGARRQGSLSPLGWTGVVQRYDGS